jgi:isopentenyl phosphate kinase
MLTFLKLGGSLITEKQQLETVRAEVLARLMGEIAEARAQRPDLRLVLGHGSGSFGHTAARTHGTRQGVWTATQWLGFAEVQAAAGRLNRLVADAARAAGLPILNLPPSASVVCRGGSIESLAVTPVDAALEHRLIPLVFGDVAFDRTLGGTIVSTEDVFGYLARALRPENVLLAGREPGVLTRWPDGEVVPEVASTEALEAVGGSHAADVTGGMASKVRQMQALASEVPGLVVRIFSGEEAGLVRAMLMGEGRAGTVIGG